jgi:hypothetical protein
LGLLCGSLIGCINMRYILRVPPSSWLAIKNGLYGFNCAGIFAAVAGDIFFQVNMGAVVLAIVGSLMVGLITLACQSVLDTDELGVPYLTLPFVTTTWLILLTRTQHLKPKSETDDLDEILFQDASRDARFFEESRPSSPVQHGANEAARGVVTSPIPILTPSKLPIRGTESGGKWNRRSPRASMVEVLKTSQSPSYRSALKAKEKSFTAGKG